MSAITILNSRTPSKTRTRQSIEGKDPCVFTDIYRDDTNMVIWQRALSIELQKAVKQLILLKPNFQSAMVVTPKNSLASLNESLDAYDGSRTLSKDISSLVDMFCCLFDLKQVGLRITILDRAMCPKFHVDRVPCRLVTTYQGIATQWLHHNKVDRSKLGGGNEGKTDEQSGLFNNLQDIHQLRTGDVALLKGEAWEGNENAGLVHRSPSLLPNEVRLLCTLDFVD